MLLKLFIDESRLGAGEAVEMAADRATAREQLTICVGASIFASQFVAECREPRLRDHVRQRHITFACEGRTKILHLQTERRHDGSLCPTKLSDRDTIARRSAKSHSGRRLKITAQRLLRYPLRSCVI